MSVKKSFFSLIFFVCVFNSFGQTSDTTMNKLRDSICNCLSKKDIHNINNSDTAQAVFLDCFSQNAATFVQLAQQHDIDITDEEAINNFSTQIGIELVKSSCPSIVQIALLMASKNKADQNNTTGIIKGKLLRIENKDFAYFIVEDENRRENSFIWLHYFPDSERFINNAKDYIRHFLEVKWKETEVYLPSAKGYFKIKEITDINMQ